MSDMKALRTNAIREQRETSSCCSVRSQSRRSPSVIPAQYPNKQPDHFRARRLCPFRPRAVAQRHLVVCCFCFQPLLIERFHSSPHGCGLHKCGGKRRLLASARSSWRCNPKQRAEREDDGEGEGFEGAGHQASSIACSIRTSSSTASNMISSSQRGHSTFSPLRRR